MLELHNRVKYLKTQNTGTVVGVDMNPTILNNVKVRFDGLEGEEEWLPAASLMLMDDDDLPF